MVLILMIEEKEEDDDNDDVIIGSGTKTTQWVQMRVMVKQDR